MKTQTLINLLNAISALSISALPVASVWAYEQSTAALEEAQKDPEFEPTKLNNLKVVGKYYLLPAGLMAVSIGTNVYVQHTLRQGIGASLTCSEALIGAANEKALVEDKFKAGVLGSAGLVGYAKIKNDANDAAYMQLDKKYRKDTDGELYFDEFSRRFFRATGPQIASALLEFSAIYARCGVVSMNDLYHSINSPDLPETVMGASYGYSVDTDWSDDEYEERLIDKNVIPIEIVSTKLDGTEYFTIRYFNQPRLLHYDDILYNYCEMDNKNIPTLYE